jgi:hypothetical protein
MPAWTQDFDERCTGFKASSSTANDFFVQSIVTVNDHKLLNPLTALKLNAEE